MFSWASFLAGFIKMINLIMQSVKEKDFINIGRKLQEDDRNAATIENIKKTNVVRLRAGANSDLDAELLIREPDEGDDTDH